MITLNMVVICNAIITPDSRLEPISLRSNYAMISTCAVAKMADPHGAQIGEGGSDLSGQT
jgi:hypothetical protein